MSQKLIIDTVLENKILNISGQGAMTFASAVEYKMLLKDWLASDVKEIVFDMKKVTQIDSAGLGLLAQTLNQAAARGLKFRVENPAASISKIFELSGLASLLEKHAGKKSP